MTKTWHDVNVVYQIYPRSYKDTNGDGIGDIRGIIEKLDYLSLTLGVEAIWISPFFLSPQTDCGYDVSDYFAVDPMFGTLDDVADLIREAHNQELKVMFDIVPNHTSDQHAWFKESRSSRENPKRDWYVWRDTPNNWVSISGGSSWQYDELTGQYFLHSFLPSQPDLNWENPDVREAMKNVVRFWFDKGVDGFRVDAAWVLSKDAEYSDDALNDDFGGSSEDYGYYVHNACKNGPRMTEYLTELSNVANEYEDKHFVFEMYADDRLGDKNEQLRAVHGVNPSFSAPMYFEAMHIPWHAEEFGRVLKDYLAVVPSEARPSICFSNHDQPRLVSRYGERQARVIAFMQMTLPGLPVMYYGDEIGMENCVIPELLTKDKFEKTGDSGGRDPERTPMQWDSSVLGGFTTDTPWLPVNENVVKKNVDDEYREPTSWLSLYERLIELRHDEVLQRGTFEVVYAGTGYVLAYKRELDERRYYVILNFADATQITELPEPIRAVIAETSPGATVVREDGRVSITGFGAALLQVGPDLDSQ